MSQFLTPLFEPGLVLDENLTKEIICKQETERLSRLYTIALTAIEIPRRVGGEATREELAADKRVCRRIAHVAMQLAKDWSNRKTVTPASDVTIEAAQVIWPVWWEEHQVFLQHRIGYVVTWGTNFGAPEKWIKSAAVRFQNEKRWLQYAMR